MNYPNEFYVLLLQLIGKHPKGNYDYALMRYFAKSTYWGREPFIAVGELIEKGLLNISETTNGSNHYELTDSGKAFLSEFELPEYLDAFAQQIDETGFIKGICYLLEGKEVSSKT